MLLVPDYVFHHWEDTGVGLISERVSFTKPLLQFLARSFVWVGERCSFQQVQLLLLVFAQCGNLSFICPHLVQSTSTTKGLVALCMGAALQEATVQLLFMQVCCSMTYDYETCWTLIAFCYFNHSLCSKKPPFKSQGKHCDFWPGWFCGICCIP